MQSTLILFRGALGEQQTDQARSTGLLTALPAKTLANMTLAVGTILPRRKKPSAPCRLLEVLHEE